MVAASIAKAMGARRTVARVYAPVFRDLSTFDYQRHFRIDRMLSLEHLSAMELARGIRQPGSVAVENFARGQLQVHELEVEEKAPSAGQLLKELVLPKGVRVGSIFRNGKMTIAGAEDRLQAGDRITLIGAQEDLDDVRDVFQTEPPPKLGVVIAGGGETGYHLARTLEGRRFAVVLMDSDMARCEYLASHLQRTTVVHCDATRRRTLEEERVGSADVFVACTGDDEDNILAGVEARELGAETIMAIVSRPDYGNIVGKLGIDHVVSPRAVMARQILGFLNKGPVISHWPLASGGSIGIMELEVVEGVPATRDVLAALKLPSQCLIAAVMHENFVRVPAADDRMVAGDTVVALVDASVTDAVLSVFNPNGRAS